MKKRFNETSQTSKLNNRRRVLVHDFDGVHFDYAKHPNMFEFFADVKVQCVEKLLPGIPAEDVKTMGRESYRKTGDGLRCFVDIAAERGLDPEIFQRDLHRLFHIILHNDATKTHPDMFLPCQRTSTAFESLQGHVRHGLLTLSCVETWAAPLLRRMKRDHFFEQGALFGFAEVGYINKANSPKPLEMIINAMGAKPEEVVFIEDSVKNLEQARILSPDILTVLITHGRLDGPPPEAADLCMPSLADTLNAFHDCFSEQPFRPVVKWNPVPFSVR